MKCEICGTALKDDLFAAVCQETVCCICKLKYVGGLPTTAERIGEIRNKLGLAEGEYLTQDNPEEASRILGRAKVQP